MVCVGWNPLSFYVGSGTDVGNPRFTFDSGGGGVSVTLSHRWPLRGLWLGVAEKLNVTEKCGINVEAWWLIPSTAAGTEESVIATTTFVAVPTPGIGFFVTIPTPVSVNWNTRPGLVVHRRSTGVLLRGAQFQRACRLSLRSFLHALREPLQCQWLRFRSVKPG